MYRRNAVIAATVLLVILWALGPRIDFWRIYGFWPGEPTPITQSAVVKRVAELEDERRSSALDLAGLFATQSPGTREAYRKAAAAYERFRLACDLAAEFKYSGCELPDPNKPGGPQ